MIAITIFITSLFKMQFHIDMFAENEQRHLNEIEEEEEDYFEEGDSSNVYHYAETLITENNDEHMKTLTNFNIAEFLKIYGLAEESLKEKHTSVDAFNYTLLLQTLFMSFQNSTRI